MDGAMGTYFDTLTTNPSAIAEEANLSDPDLIRSIHKMYLDSGARLIRTNTFAINHSLAVSKGLKDATAQDQYLRELIKAAWNIACEAVKDSGHPAWIAADIGPIAESFPFSESDLDEAAEYRFLADCFLDCGAEIFNFETQSDIHTVLQTRHKNRTSHRGRRSERDAPHCSDKHNRRPYRIRTDNMERRKIQNFL